MILIYKNENFNFLFEIISGQLKLWRLLYENLYMQLLTFFEFNLMQSCFLNEVMFSWYLIELKKFY